MCHQLTRATALANRAGVRTVAIDHLIFNIRHDRAKVSRLQSFLSWKDVRKNTRTEEGGADDFGAGGPDAADPSSNIGGPGGPSDAVASKTKKKKVRLPWDISTFYAVALPERDDDDENGKDEEEEEMNTATLQRLRNADERTKHMTREEYVHFSECRQASFTYRKGKRFREWAGFGVVTDSKPNDDVVDTLGFLTFEIVQTLTEEALKIKAEEDARVRLLGPGVVGGGDGDRGQSASLKRKRECPLFEPPEEERTPIQLKHVLEAFRRSQQQGPRDRAFAFAIGRRVPRRPLKYI
jgi:transcription initiation protein SPT3